ncbi:aminotransferase DegT [Sorangium cellulosum]|uniref:Aminotransferase DegT n=1 Tax=Sorangium cellulosum TaxID=56 RepID=A0A150TGU6_SORCE|nr:aminotransferase DegT [Sorangium cellulosum]
MTAVIPFYTCAASLERQRGEIDALIDELFAGGSFTDGALVRRLERRIALFTEARHTIACGNATDALTIMLMAAGVGPGDEVIVPSFSFFASASSIAHAGAKPVFVDIDPVTYAMDPAQISAAVTRHTRAVMPVHLFTQMADMPTIVDVARLHGLLVLEDSAEGIGMWLGGQHAGLIGDAGVLSFFPTKTLGAFGDAGMVLTNDDRLAEAARMLRNHGQREGEPQVYRRLGFNSRMDSLQAAILLARLGRLPQEIARRAQLAALYDRGLAGLSASVSTPRIRRRPEGAGPVYYVYLIECEQRDALASHLAAEGIGTETYYPVPLHLQPCFRGLGYVRGDMPVAERACTRTLGLPMYPDMTAGQVERVCGAIADFFQRGGAR